MRLPVLFGLQENNETLLNLELSLNDILLLQAMFKTAELALSEESKKDEYTLDEVGYMAAQKERARKLFEWASKDAEMAWLEMQQYTGEDKQIQMDLIKSFKKTAGLR